MTTIVFDGRYFAADALGSVYQDGHLISKAVVPPKIWYCDNLWLDADKILAVGVIGEISFPLERYLNKIMGQSSSSAGPISFFGPPLGSNKDADPFSRNRKNSDRRDLKKHLELASETSYESMFDNCKLICLVYPSGKPFHKVLEVKCVRTESTKEDLKNKGDKIDNFSVKVKETIMNNRDDILVFGEGKPIVTSLFRIYENCTAMELITIASLFTKDTGGNVNFIDLKSPTPKVDYFFDKKVIITDEIAHKLLSEKKPRPLDSINNVNVNFGRHDLGFVTIKNQVAPPPPSFLAPPAEEVPSPKPPETPSEAPKEQPKEQAPVDPKPETQPSEPPSPPPTEAPVPEPAPSTPPAQDPPPPTPEAKPVEVVTA